MWRIEYYRVFRQEEVDRIVPFDRRTDLGMDRMLSDVDLNQ